MATLQARIFLVAFVALAIAITYNATFRQEGTHPAPMANERDESSVNTVSRHGTVPRTAKKLPKLVENAAPSAIDKNVMAIQRQLHESGYDPGPADGVLGEQTRAAIIAFETDNKLPLTGIASEELLKAMILGVPSAEAGKASNGKMAEETTVLIKSIQQTLAKLGYDPGPVDGLIGTSTGQAIQKFEADRKLPATGRISGKLIKQLKQASGGKLSVIASR